VRPGKEAWDGIPRISDLNDLTDLPDLIVDCGGHAALAAHGPVALGLGIDVLTVSLGALANADLAAKLRASAIEGSARLQVVSGAVGGLDALRAANTRGLEKVTYIGRKPPIGWIGSPAESAIDLQNIQIPTAHFNGTARHGKQRWDTRRTPMSQQRLP
jgi:aspartate dehydrogenase